MTRRVLARLRKKHYAKRRDLRREATGVLHNDEVQIPAGFSSVGAPLSRQELKASLSKVFSQISQNDREVLELIHLEGLSLQEAADKLQLTNEAIKKRYSRAIKRLRCESNASLLRAFAQQK